MDHAAELPAALYRAAESCARMAGATDLRTFTNGTTGLRGAAQAKFATKAAAGVSTTADLRASTNSSATLDTTTSACAESAAEPESAAGFSPATKT
ncbi:hypothetical protein A5662_16825 [Mycobacteriaceae bacterium 1482268.1]|nr:hypothetical protein A5662_16825 [Mycobacteriaceae bacterium 1482268.1]